MKIFKRIIILTLLIGTLGAYSGTLNVGIARFAPPFSEVDASNHYFGFCIDLLNEICKRINETCKYKAFLVENILDELDNGAIDISLAPTPIPATPLPDHIFSIPFMTSNGLFVTSNQNIKSLADLKDKKIGIMSEANLSTVVLLYTSSSNIKEYTHVTELISALMDNSVDAILLNEHIYKYLTINQIIDFFPIGKSINLGNGYGIVALDKNTMLIEKINKALLDMENDGTYEKIYSKYFGR